MNKLCLLVVLLVSLAACVPSPQGPEPLRLQALQVEPGGPAREKLGGVRWQATASGGRAPLHYQLQGRTAGLVFAAGRTVENRGRWQANKPGTYQFRLLVEDSAEQQVVSDWSAAFGFAPALDRNAVYAVLPPANLSDSPAPLEEIRRAWVDTLKQQGLRILDQNRLEDFMRRERMRYVGGIDSRIAEQLRKAAGVDGVFVTTVETWSEKRLPRVSLFSRLVLTGEWPEILWLDGVGLTGDDETGLLGLGRVTQAQELLEKGMGQLAASLEGYLSGTAPAVFHDLSAGPRVIRRTGTQQSPGTVAKLKRRFRPRSDYRASTFAPGQEYQVAIIPFLNINARKYSGQIVPLHLLRELLPYANLRLIEPGVVREKLLRYRMVMQSGPSLAASDVLADPRILGADLIVSGKVFDFQDRSGASKVDFSVQAFDGPQREVVWTSRSYTSSREDVYFFDWGAVPSAYHLTGNLAHSASRLLERR